jgi:prepilin-type N-terminal cleavage/methylation domain-containing protein
MTFHRTNFLRRRGFSLTEILIVIALIVLMLALALPAFNFITGGKSIDGAMNQISAFLSRARTEAVGLQEIRGVMFYIDPATERQMMVLVKQVTPAPAYTGPVEVWLDAMDADHIPLPKGVGIQVLNDSTSGSADRYLGFNSYSVGGSNPTIPVGGMILFDGYGRLASARYGFHMQDPQPSGPAKFSAMATLILAQPQPAAAPGDFAPPPVATPPLSSFGFCLFDQNTIRDKFGDKYYEDPTFTTTTSETAGPGGEESWLDDNATAVLINRYNGTLVKGE